MVHWPVYDGFCICFKLLPHGEKKRTLTFNLYPKLKRGETQSLVATPWPRNSSIWAFRCTARLTWRELASRRLGLWFTSHSTQDSVKPHVFPLHGCQREKMLMTGIVQLYFFFLNHLGDLLIYLFFFLHSCSQWLQQVSSLGYGHGGCRPSRGVTGLRGMLRVRGCQGWERASRGRLKPQWPDPTSRQSLRHVPPPVWFGFQQHRCASPPDLLSLSLTSWYWKVSFWQQTVKNVYFEVSEVVCFWD